MGTTATAELALALAIIIAGGAIAGSAQAQSWRLEKSIEATLLYSDNPSFDPPGQEQGAATVALRPRLALRRIGPRLRVDGEIGVDLTKHSNADDRSGASPFARGSLNAELIERWVFVDASVDVARIEADPFAARGSETSNFNRRLTSTYRLSPYIDRPIGPSWNFRARSDATWTRQPSETDTGLGTLPRRDVESRHDTLVVERKPEPVGGAVELSRSRSRSSSDADRLLDVDSIRVVGSVGIDDALIGAFAGRERSTFFSSEETNTVYGLRLRWRPSTRTDLAAQAEKRFFGTGVDVRFTHRMPWLATSLQLRREPVTNPFAVQLGGGGVPIASFLDAILTTRYPDPIERSKLVRDIVVSQGLPETFTGAVILPTRYAQLEQGGNASFVLLGRRNTLTLSAYAVTFRQLQRDDDAILSSLVPDNDTRQVGASGGFARRLSPVTAAEVSLGWSRTEGLRARAGERSIQRVYRLSFTHTLNPRTAATAGLVRRSATSNVTTDDSFEELSGFVGITHRF